MTISLKLKYEDLLTKYGGKKPGWGEEPEPQREKKALLRVRHTTGDKKPDWKQDRSQHRGSWSWLVMFRVQLRPTYKQTHKPLHVSERHNGSIIRGRSRVYGPLLFPHQDHHKYPLAIYSKDSCWKTKWPQSEVVHLLTGHFLLHLLCYQLKKTNNTVRDKYLIWIRTL